MPKYMFHGSYRWEKMEKMEKMDMKGLNQAIRRWLVVIVSLVLVSVALLPSISEASETSQPGYVALAACRKSHFERAKSPSSGHHATWLSRNQR
jgi:hypothetical protein